MPELPDAVVYVEALERHVLGQPLERVRLTSPFLVRSFDPPVSTVEGRRVDGVRRLGKPPLTEIRCPNASPSPPWTA